MEYLNQGHRKSRNVLHLIQEIISEGVFTLDIHLRSNTRVFSRIFTITHLLRVDTRQNEYYALNTR